MHASHPSVDQVFAETLQRPAGAERDSYLDEVCVNDADLRQRVERLLRAYDDAASFLESPAEAIVDRPAIEQPGMQIGPYKLLEQIGEGGFGVVFMAEQQQPVRRKVALKVIKPGMDTRAVIVRFEAERQALAVMDHPNIAKVFDAGETASGRPYFVMELVRGLSITEYCDQVHLATRQRLALFAGVCQAVQHAHQKGIIHRDLKPSNVLIAVHDGQPSVKIIDFGIAKATGTALTDKTLFTGFAQMIGTPLYMSPEQAGQSPDIDTRSDIYSLGVLMYELLTGTTPFDKDRFKTAAYDEIRRIIREEEPPKPSTRLSESQDSRPAISVQRQIEPAKLTRLVRGELDWIVMKALEKDRARRYETASKFAEDIQHYLSDEAVVACPPSARYRFRKFARRNKAALVMATTVALALLVAVGSLIGNYVVVAREKEQKAAALARALQEKQRADQNLVRARKAVNEYLTLAANNPLLKEADFHELRRNLLESAVPFYQEFVEQQQEDAQLEAERGRAYGDLALVREELGELDQALTAHEQRRAIFERLVAGDPSMPSYRQELANSYRNLGNVYLDMNQHAQAEPAFRQAAKMLSALTEQHPLEAPYRQDLAGAYSNLSIVLRALGRLDEALDVQQQAVALRERLVNDSPSAAEFRRDLAGSLLNLSSVFSNLGRHDDGLTAIGRAAELLGKLAEEHPSSPLYREMWGTSLDNQSVLLCDLGRRDQGLAALQQAVRIHEKLAADFQSVPGYRHGLALSLMNLSTLQAELGRHDEGLATCERALAILAKLTGESPNVAAYQQALALTYRSQADLHGRLNRQEPALAALGKCLSIQEKLVADSPLVPRLREDLSLTHNALGEALCRLGRYDESSAAYEKALAIREELARGAPTVVGYAVQLAATYGAIGNLKLEQNQTESALDRFDQALARLTPVLAAEPRLAMARSYASKIYLSRSTALGELARHAEALADLDRALALDDGEDRQTIRLQRARTMAHLRMHSEATAEIEALAEISDLPAKLIQDAAVIYAICSVQVRDDAPLSERYAAGAVALLRRAFEQDDRAVANDVAQDAKFDALRSREDFQQLLKEIEGKPSEPGTDGQE